MKGTMKELVVRIPIVDGKDGKPAIPLEALAGLMYTDFTSDPLSGEEKVMLEPLIVGPTSLRGKPIREVMNNPEFKNYTKYLKRTNFRYDDPERNRQLELIKKLG